jgi:predicted dehydrogenase
MKANRSRRKFLQQLGSTSLLLASGSMKILAADERTGSRVIPYTHKISANDKIRIACIGMGIMGHADCDTALKVPGVELVAACDLYTGRLDRVKEKYGKDIYTTRDYRELLLRNDIDAILIATSDNWHARLTIDALNSGKAVYCEKPVVQKISDGLSVIAAQKKTGKPMQVGSQLVSSIVNHKAREVYNSGAIGQLNCIEASYDRQSALGAWEYTMPTDVSPQTVDWDRYIESMSNIPWDPKKFFWWRNYRDFGTGVAGDLFVHLLSGIHLITGSLGPKTIFASGQLCYWKDGRDVPDVMTAIMQYPETKEHPPFQVMLRVNFVSGMGEHGVTRYIGSEGVLEMVEKGFNLSHSILSKAPGIGGWDAIYSYPQAMQDELIKQYNLKFTAEEQKRPEKSGVNYVAPEGYDEHFEHFKNFFDGVRDNIPLVEGPEFGFRAAAPTLACNDSYFQKKIISWDPINMKVV